MTPPILAGRVLGQAWGSVAPDYKALLEERAAEDKRRYDAEMNFVAQSASHLDSPLSWLHPSIGPRTNEGDGIWSVDAADDARRRRRDAQVLRQAARVRARRGHLQRLGLQPRLRQAQGLPDGAPRRGGLRRAAAWPRPPPRAHGFGPRA